MVRAIVNSTPTRYIIAGGVSYAAELGVLALLTVVFQLSPLAAVAISFWVGFLAAFFLQKFFTYKSSAQRPSVLLNQLILYAVLVFCNYIFTLLFVAFVSALSDVFVSRTVALILTTIWNFFLYREVIFKYKH